MVALKDFKPGQTAYVINDYMHSDGLNRESVRETTVTGVGRKYVTVQNGRRYFKNETRNGLEQVPDDGRTTYLFPSRELALEEIEHRELTLWFTAKRYFANTLSIDQLRTIRSVWENRMPERMPTGVCDINGTELYTGDTVSLVTQEQTGKVTFEAGSYGIAFGQSIDWDALESLFPGKFCSFLHNDNFISFWELIWNFDCEDGICDPVQKKGENDT